jgi:hypothetical protein
LASSSPSGGSGEPLVALFCENPFFGVVPWGVCLGTSTPWVNDRLFYFWSYLPIWFLSVLVLVRSVCLFEFVLMKSEIGSCSLTVPFFCLLLEPEFYLTEYKLLNFL